MSNHPLFDEEEGDRRKLRGQAKVTEKDKGRWARVALGVLVQPACKSDRVTSDDLRREMCDQGFPDPHHQNAWGAIFTAAAGRGHIMKTSFMRKSKRKKANGREIRVWHSLRTNT